MTDSNKDSILELFELNKKSVLCCSLNEVYITGLINRGAKIWFKESDREEVMKYLNSISGKSYDINFIKQDSIGQFDYSLLDEYQYKNLNNDQSLLIKNFIIINVNKFKFVKWVFSQRVSPNYDSISIYSVVPSLQRIKLIIPEDINIPIERYWTFSNSNPYVSFKLISDWIFIKNNLLRRIFSDKLIVIEC